MGKVVIVEAVPGRAFVAALRSIWEEGDAILPWRADAPPPGPLTVAAEAAAVIATSGSTGEPRLVELSHEAVRAAAAAAAERLGPGAVWSCLLPLHHVAGFMTVARSVLAGAAPVFDDAEPASYVSLVPIQLKRMLDGGADLSRWRAILVGGGPVSRRLVEAATDAGGNVIVTYGQTESCGGVVYNGRALTGTEVQLRDSEIFLRGPTLMTGYVNDPSATAAKLAGGWLATGDAGSLRDGVLQVTGRMDEVIITGGEKVSPEEVERVLSDHDSVMDAAVAGVPDPEWGRRVVASVVVSDEGLEPEAVRAWLRGRLDPHKVPKEIRFVHQIPRTPSGKVRRRELAASFAPESP